MLKRYRQGVIPTRSDELATDAASVVEQVRNDLGQFQLQSALEAIWRLVARANQYVDQTAPFKLAKEAAQAERLDAVLYNLVETCRVIGVLLWPFLPVTSERLFGQLGLTISPSDFNETKWGGLQSGHLVGEPAPLFPRKDLLQK